jgi:hypothetical protein
MNEFISSWAAVTGLSPWAFVGASIVGAGAGGWLYLQVLRVFPKLNLVTLIVGGALLVLRPVLLSLYEAFVLTSEHSGATALGIFLVGIGGVGSYVVRRQSRQDRKLRQIWDRFYDRDVAMNAGR